MNQPNNNKMAFGRVLAESISPMMTDCYVYGMVSGCDSGCPVLCAGKCELYASVEAFEQESEGEHA